MGRENAHRVIGVDATASCMQVSPQRAKVARRGACSALARVKWWAILLGRLAGWSVLRVACVMCGALGAAARL